VIRPECRWEPILATDWRPPSGSTLRRIGDRRVRQFWDPNHLVSSGVKDIVGKNDASPKPDCCLQKGFHWDEAILFPVNAHWRDNSAPVFWNGPVVKVISRLEPSLSNQH